MTAEHEIWIVMCNTDLTEGRGEQFAKYYCQTEATARRLAVKGYVQGSDCPVRSQKAVLFDGSYYFPWSIRPIPPSPEDVGVQKRIDAAKAREDALAKAASLGMTDDEITILRGTPHDR